MGAQCNGTCYATNQYDADISVILDKTQYRRLKKEDVQSDKLELGPDKFADAQTRDAILRECPLSQVFDNEFQTKNSAVIVRIQSFIRMIMSIKRLKRRISLKQELKYFSDSEIKETLKTGETFSPDQQPICKPAFTYKNGSTYVGEWVNGFRHGKGWMLWPDGAAYEGQWGHGYPTNYGVFTYPNGDVYSGTWAQNQMHGTGTFKHKSGAVYVGEWQLGRRHGVGYEKWPDGSEYTGQYVAGKKEGTGTFKASDGSIYTGQWLSNQTHGYGVHSWPDQRLYVGQSFNGLIHGLGRYTWSDGRIYEGEYKDDQKSGFGIYTWTDGKMYRGYWKDGKQNGLAQFIFTNENQQEEVRYGFWRNGTRQRLFEVVTTVPIDQQLKQIEEKLIQDTKVDYSFTPPVKFFEKLANSILQSKSAQETAAKIDTQVKDLTVKINERK